MKYLLIFPVLCCLGNFSHAQNIEPRIGKICHAEPEYSNYNYAGLWELGDDGKLQCNYWQFLSDEQKKEAIELRFGSRLDNKDSYDNNIDDETDYELEIYIYEE